MKNRAGTKRIHNVYISTEMYAFASLTLSLTVRPRARQGSDVNGLDGIGWDWIWINIHLI
jgi:hypothetical protein